MKDSTEEKVWTYLLEHKTPVLIKTLAKRYILSESRISTILKKFHDQGIVDLIKIGTTKYYKVKE
jgi:predicted transcriptional regulator